jgi:hypothetical protein
VLGVVRTEERRHFARRHKIRQVLDCRVIGAKLLEVSLVKLASAFGAWPNQVLRPALGAMCFSHSSTLAMIVREPARPDAVHEHRRPVKDAPRVRCLRGTDLGKVDRGLHSLFIKLVNRNWAVSAIISTMLVSVHPPP